MPTKKIIAGDAEAPTPSPTTRKRAAAPAADPTAPVAAPRKRAAAAITTDPSAPIVAPRKRAASTASADATTPTKKATTKKANGTTTRSTTKKASGTTARSTIKKATSTTRSTTSRTTKKATGEGSSSVRASVSTIPQGVNLVIVESPTKAKTISKYLGRGYAVRASYGHVRDLPKSKMGVDTEHDFTPQYLIPREKSATVKELKADVARAKAIYLATDPDREGEAIAWHLLEATQAAGKPVYRVEFHEVTKEAVQHAIAHPRTLDMDLVNAQQARRILDRLVGYSISPILWRKVKGGLSAGRVQSVAVRLIVEREREIEAFVAVEYWSIEVDLQKQVAKPKRSDQFHAALAQVNGKKAEIGNAEDANAIIKGLDGAGYVVSSVKTREVRRSPVAPFTTSTLQQEAGRKLGYTARRTMIIAQQLYEGIDVGGGEGSVGLITYMRTDSTNVAASAQAEARQVIAARYGESYLPPAPPTYTKKSKNAQEAHEAIRPTVVGRDPEAIKASLTAEQYKLYKLIWQRFLASQMTQAVFDSTSVEIAAGKGTSQPYLFRTSGSVIKFPGFLAVYREDNDDETAEQAEDKQPPLPRLEVGEPLDLLKLLPLQHFTQPPPRYTEASLVKMLEEQGIGRPSTYAPTLATIQDRGYVMREDKKLVPTELGMIVNDLLVQHFAAIVNPSFTSRMEQELDDISNGERAWQPVIASFYNPLHEAVELADTAIGKVVVRDLPTGEACEKCASPLVIKLGRYGKFIACSGFPNCRNTRPFGGGTGVTCPQCAQGEIIEKRSKKGRVFFSCGRYPDCVYSLWDRPLASPPCPACGALLTLRGKDGQTVKCSACSFTAERDSLPAALPTPPPPASPRLLPLPLAEEDEQLFAA